MAAIFWITTISCISVWVYRMVKKDYFSILTYVVFGIYLPVFLYFAKWSTLITVPVQSDFYYIFICFNFILLFVQFFDPVIKNNGVTQIRFKLNSGLIIAIDAIYVVSMLIENYLGSGFLLPALHGIDIHTFHAPLLFYISGASYVIIAFNTLYALSAKRGFLLFDLLVIALLFVGKSARMDAFIAIVEIASLVIFTGVVQLRRKISVDEGIEKKSFEKRRHVIRAAAAVGLACLVLIAVNIGNDRMNHYGTYDLKYEEGIGYDGPELFGNIMAYYYGYFPFSFCNLNNNIAFVGYHEKYIGQDSFRAFYFGILQSDNLFDLPLNEANDSKVIVTRGATVTTGFWDFYFDYGELCFIPMIMSMIIYVLLRQNLMRNAKAKPSAFLSYFYWVPLWFFMSFNDTIWDTCVLVNLSILLLVSDKLFEIRGTKLGELM